MKSIFKVVYLNFSEVVEMVSLKVFLTLLGYTIQLLAIFSAIRTKYSPPFYFFHRVLSNKLLRGREKILYSNCIYILQIEVIMCYLYMYRRFQYLSQFQMKIFSKSLCVHWKMDIWKKNFFHHLLKSSPNNLKISPIWCLVKNIEKKKIYGEIIY